MKPVLVDSNVLIDVFSDSPDWFDWSRNHLTYFAQTTRLYINPIIYSEISIGFAKIEELELCLSSLPVGYQELPKEALYLAGKAYLNYKKSKGNKLAPLPDFFIGAHAAVNRWQLITRDPGRMKYYFPAVEIISPDENKL